MGGSPVRVLLVDDQADVRALLRRALVQFTGIDVVGEAGNGAEAVRQAAELSPDVIVLDLNMPGGRGEAAVPALRRELPGVKIAILTGDAVNQDLGTTVDVCLKKSSPISAIVAELVALARRTSAGGSRDLT